MPSFHYCRGSIFKPLSPIWLRLPKTANYFNVGQLCNAKLWGKCHILFALIMIARSGSVGWASKNGFFTFGCKYCTILEKGHDWRTGMAGGGGGAHTKQMPHLFVSKVRLLYCPHFVTGPAHLALRRLNRGKYDHVLLQFSLSCNILNIIISLF